MSGVTSGTIISALLLVAIRERARTRPKARVVPRKVPTIIVTNAISMLAKSDWRSVALLKNSSYHWKLKPLNICSDGLELKENSATITSGAKVNTMKSQKKARRKRGRSNPLRLRLRP